jgi:hypothetical protein
MMLDSENTRRKVMKSRIYWAASIGLLSAVVGSAVADTVTSVNVVGVFNIEVPANTRQITAIPMHKLPAVRGVITANDTTTITDANASWNADQFAWGVAGQEATGSSYFYVEVTGPEDAALLGRHFYIDSNTATKLTIRNGISDPVPDLTGASYKIVAANRVRDIFGEPGAPILQGGVGPGDSNADNIRLWDADADGWDQLVYYNNNAADTLRNGHWIKSGQLADNEFVDRDESFLVTRNADSKATITALGEVSANAQTVVVAAGSRAFLGGMVAVDMPIGQSGLKDADGFAGGVGPGDAAALKLRKWNAAADGWDSAVYFNSNAADTLRNGHWIKDGQVVDDTLVLSAGEGYLLTSPGTLEWTRPSPLQ